MKAASTLFRSPGAWARGWQAKVPGIAAAAALAQAAGWIAGGLGDPLARNPVLVAMLFGLLLGTCFECPAALRPGLDFSKRYLLRLGVVLLGFRVTVALLADLGIVPITIAAVELVTVLLVVRVVAIKVFKLDPGLALLIAVGAAVCGAAAILSTAALTRAREQQAGVAITLITIAGTLALLLYPVAFVAGWMPGLDDRSFGVAVGASIFELAQVYGASYSVSEGALNAATLVKLSKVVMLVPLLLVFGVIQARRERSPQPRAPGAAGKARLRVPIPWFVFGFLAVLLVNSAITLDPNVRRLVLEGDQFLFLMVMVALGLTTPVARLRAAGGAWRLIGIALVALAVSAASAYGLVALAGLTPKAAAAQGVANAPTVAVDAAGARLFDAVGCAKCHVPSLRGDRGDVLLYSDLLLHDMGAALDDKIVQGSATGADWRTTPLLGLGLRQRYLHDGRAVSLRDAVLDHGGEASIVRQRFFDLAEADQQAVYRFLSAL
ncbi:MAG: putative sulfate exporter family transporter [Burkholderiaceae bacterium]